MQLIKIYIWILLSRQLLFKECFYEISLFFISKIQEINDAIVVDLKQNSYFSERRKKNNINKDLNSNSLMRTL